MKKILICFLTLIIFPITAVAALEEDDDKKKKSEELHKTLSKISETQQEEMKRAVEMNRQEIMRRR